MEEVERILQRTIANIYPLKITTVSFETFIREQTAENHTSCLSPSDAAVWICVLTNHSKSEINVRSVNVAWKRNSFFSPSVRSLWDVNWWEFVAAASSTEGSLSLGLNDWIYRHSLFSPKTCKETRTAPENCRGTAVTQHERFLTPATKLLDLKQQQTNQKKKSLFSGPVA